MFNMSTKQMIINAMIAALYVVLTIASSPIAYGSVQFRVSEILVLLPFFNPSYALGVTIGTFIANYMGPFGLLDAVLGSLISLTAMIVIVGIRRILGEKLSSLFAASLIPVILNAFYVAILIVVIDQLPWNLLPEIGLSVAIGEFVVVSIVGVAVFGGLSRHQPFRRQMDLD